MTSTPDHADIRDAILPLAHSLHATPSSHVLLLAAGASMAAGMPSAWAVQIDLITDIARQRGHKIEPVADTELGEAEVAWYRETFSEEPTYQALLSRLGHTQTERQRLLRRFFDADDESDRKIEVTQPSAVHRAIAELVKSGHVRVIVTLNFDTLIEQALREVGIEPTVLSSRADVAGMAPLHTHDALVVHLHGQYLAPASMRNTIDELAVYDETENKLLDHLFTDYGVVVVGWSATHDTALRDALARTRCSHFSSYWIEPGALSPIAEQLRVNRTMTLVSADADTALSYLRDAIMGLAHSATRNPTAPAVAVAVAKRQLASGNTPIALHDTLNAEFARVRSLPLLTEAALGLLPDDQYEALLRRVETEAAVSTALVATTAFWGNEDTDAWLASEVERSLRPVLAGGVTKVLRLPHLPGLLWCSSGAIAAAAAGRWGLVRSLLVDIAVVFPGDRPRPAATALTPGGLHLERPHSYPFDLLEPTFTTYLGRTPAAWVDAWEAVELLRMAIGLSEGYRSEVETAVAEVDRASKTSDDAGSTAFKEAVAALASRVRVHAAHIRVRDTTFDDQYWPVTGLRLSAALQRSGESHPLVQAGVLGAGFLRHSLILEAVNAKIAQTGNAIAWRGAGDSGTLMSHIPDYIWLDSAETPERDI